MVGVCVCVCVRVCVCIYIQYMSALSADQSLPSFVYHRLCTRPFARGKDSCHIKGAYL